MDKNEIREVLEQHQLWLNFNGGKRADLHGVDLRGVDLHDTDLRCADLYGADLYGVDLRGANLYGANLRGADLRYADLYDADLRYTNLYGADLCYTDLRDTDLRCADLSDASIHEADLRDADLRGAKLSDADLSGAKLDNVKYNYRTSFFALQCPEEGSFIGYKKAGRYIVKLEILADAKRSSATSRKCRCSSAKVLSVTTLDGQDDGTRAVSSNYDKDFIYRVGEIVRVDNFDDNRWRECSRGIHFFITRDEAVRYS